MENQGRRPAGEIQYLANDGRLLLPSSLTTKDWQYEPISQTLEGMPEA